MSPAAQRADLMTAVMHEMGDVLGDNDTSAADLLERHLAPWARDCSADIQYNEEGCRFP